MIHPGIKFNTIVKSLAVLPKQQWIVDKTCHCQCLFGRANLWLSNVRLLPSFMERFHRGGERKGVDGRIDQRMEHR